jgi:hypothetical protein
MRRETYRGGTDRPQLISATEDTRPLLVVKEEAERAIVRAINRQVLAGIIPIADSTAAIAAALQRVSDADSAELVDAIVNEVGDA